MTICGFDFGTSNSAIGVVDGRVPRLIEFEQQQVIRSAIFVDFEDRQIVYGNAGVDDYLSGIPGRLIMSLKSVLGSALMDEKTNLLGTWMPYTDVLGLLLGHIKRCAEVSLGAPITQVVLGRPVRFSDHDDERDRRAADTLRAIAHSVGFEHVEFQFEPVAAALAFETGIAREQLSCVIDLGGGTADFSVIRLGPERRAQDRSQDVLANHGVHVGGTDLDYRLSLASVMGELGLGGKLRNASGSVEMPSYYYHELSRWHRIFDMYAPRFRDAIKQLLGVAHEPEQLRRLLTVLERKLGHDLLHRVEQCKQSLSHSERSTIDLDRAASALSVTVSRGDFVQSIEGEIARLHDALAETLNRAGVRAEHIDCAFLTGGTGLVPAVRSALTRVLAPVQLVTQDPFTAVAQGLTLDAVQRFR